MAKFGHVVMMQKKKEKAQLNVTMPKGFDITLTQLVEKHELSTAQLRELGRLTATRRSGLAHATVGNNVYYRERQVLEMLVIPTMDNTGMVLPSTNIVDDLKEYAEKISNKTGGYTGGYVSGGSVDLSKIAMLGSRDTEEFVVPLDVLKTIGVDQAAFKTTGVDQTVQVKGVDLGD